jgi:uncharacterized membrane protein
MRDVSTILGVVHLVTGFLVVALCIPLVRRRVGRNPLYGVRLAKSFESDANWYEINAFGGRVMAVAGAAIALVGIAVLLWPPSSTTSIVLVSLAPVPIVLLGVAPIVRFARRLR